MGDLEKVFRIVAELRRRVVRILLVLAPLFGFLLTFQIRSAVVNLAGHPVPIFYPYPNLFDNVTAQVFVALTTLLPPGVILFNLGIADAVLVQVEIGALLTVILGMPWIVHEVGAFLMPALRTSERALLRQIGIPATALFAFGTAIGLFFFTPLTFRFLFEYVGALGVSEQLSIQSFVTFTILYPLAFGIVFELPVFVYALTRVGAVPAASWKKHWRGAVIGSLLFGMLVTPDNSGVTMLLVASPMIALYFAGAYFAGRWERDRDRPARPSAVAG
jgi:sec-independent protein translocase protein TatC